MAATDHTRMRTARVVAREKSTDNSRDAARGNRDTFLRLLDFDGRRRSSAFNPQTRHVETLHDCFHRAFAGPVEIDLERARSSS